MRNENRINETQRDTLQRALDGGIINYGTVEKLVRMQEREEILKAHGKSIWQSKRNGHWFVYLPDERKGRVRKERHTKEEIEDIVVAFYGSDAPQAQPQKPKTLESLFPDWFDFKVRTGIADSYAKKIYDHWVKYYENDPIIKTDIQKLTRIELEMWAHELIDKCKKSKTEYYNAALIIRNVLLFAVNKGYLAESPFEEFKIDPKCFEKRQKKPDETQVFLTDEQPKVEAVCWEKFNKRPKYVSVLAIPLAFRLGVRVGELAALRESDIHGDYIHIQRAEVPAFKREKGSLKPVYDGARVEEHTKSSAGDREMFITPEAHRLIDIIIASNREHGNQCEDYLFVCGDKRLKANTLNKQLYDCCVRAGVAKKSSHKMRKTFISTLVDADFNINTIRKAVGHESETTTYASYVFDRRPKDEIEERLGAVLDISSSSSSKTHQKLTKARQ